MRIICVIVIRIDMFARGKAVLDKPVFEATCGRSQAPQ